MPTKIIKCKSELTSIKFKVKIKDYVFLEYRDFMKIAKNG